MPKQEVASHTPPAFKGIALDAKCKCGHEWGHHQMVEPHKCITGEQEQGCGCAAFRPVGLRTTPLRAAIKSMAVEGELEALKASNRELLAALEAAVTEIETGVLSSHELCECCHTVGIHDHDQRAECHFETLGAELANMKQAIAKAKGGAQAEAAIQRAKP